MKAFLLAGTLLLSQSVLALDLTMSPLLTSAATSLSGPEKQAQLIIEDSQEYALSGKLSVLLSQKVNELKQLDETLSTDEAVDLLLEASAN